MKISYSYFKRTCLFLALFCWLLPMNLFAQIAIGTGTVTLDYTNTSDPVAPVTNTFVLSNLSTPIASETCIAFGSTDWGGGVVLSQVEWSATIVPGIYEIEFTYGTGSWGVKPLVSVYDGSTKVTDIYSAPSGQTSGAWKGQADFSPAPMDVDLQGLTAGKTYTIRVTDEWGGGYGLCVGHISFTRKDGGCASPVDASFAKAGDETGSVPMTINTCAGSTFSIPGAGSLAKAGYDFVGWSYNSTTYAPGASFTMPATDVSFTAVWEQHYVPAVTNLSSSVSGSDVTLNWINYNKLEMTSSNVAIEGWSDGSNEMSYTIVGGVLTANYTIYTGWTRKCVEIRLPRERRHVTSIDLKYRFNDPNCASEGGLLPYMMYDGEESGHEGNWTSYFLDYTLSNATEWTDFNLVPTNILWGSGSGAYDDQWLIHKVGVSINPPVASSGTFSIKDIYINTYDGQTLLDEVIVVRKQGSAPASVNDGTQVYAGLLNTCSDNGLADGDYYYAVFAREGDAYSAAVVEQVHIGAPSLTYYERAVTPGEYGTVCIGYAVEHANISGATMYEIDSWSADGKALTLSELGDSESMVAGRPYIFYATGNLLSLGYDGSASEASAGDHNGLIGSYSQEEITANADNYIIYQNKLWLVDVLAYVGANRAYIHKTTNASPAPERRQIKLYVAGTEVATGLEQINGTCPDGKFIQDGQLFIRRDGRTYNAQGIEIK